ncbi:TRAP transporter large permease [Pollutimonas thiosulfatoxidans]|uniref:TRAP transporter large permease protein n=1 Tax=Pollutimonas thiosulfatoxidans TaxID=2028345 RepID=A0A410GE59_9BURK|nr:TRAP transporter large permease subunit [Pollutimonas thiosulfatoxidans]MBF6617652.1 TRAP transporter large permease subunit [Candidimonas sp.]QAA94580.1 C4-dicarboxylate ABC transporter permease [Pollutimonas thiosulfatoxidans]
MSDAVMSFIFVAVLIGSLALGLWVSIALFVTGLVGIVLFSNAPLLSVLATNMWSTSAEWSLAALPLFIWMGEILFRSRMSKDLFSGLAPWMRSLPGGLGHVGVLASGLFAAVSGSSAATCATVAKVAVPELKARGYDEKLILGTVAGSATLGLLIPPSIILIVYGVAAELSIARLFIAGVLPGVMVIGLFMGYVAIWSAKNRDKVPPKDPPVSFVQKLKATRTLLPVALLIIGVVGSIYLGLASPTDSAAVGVVIALLLSWLFGDLNWKTFKEGLISATLSSSMIAFILAGSAFLTIAMGYANLPANIARWISDMGISTYGLLAVLTVFFIVMGCFLDGISIVVLTTAVLLPAVQAAGIDPIWFGIYLVLVVEMGQLTPPVGLNLFVLQGMTGRDIVFISKAAFPFFALLIVAVVLVVLFPKIVLVLPEMMYG